MPVFEGFEPDEWVFHVERYFSINRMAEEQKVEAAIICFDGEALAWFKWEDNRRPMKNWEEVKVCYIGFDPRKKGCAQFLSLQQSAQFLSLQQSFTVREYRQ